MEMGHCCSIPSALRPPSHYVDNLVGRGRVVRQIDKGCYSRAAQPRAWHVSAEGTGSLLSSFPFIAPDKMCSLVEASGRRGTPSQKGYLQGLSSFLSGLGCRKTGVQTGGKNPRMSVPLSSSGTDVSICSSARQYMIKRPLRQGRAGHH